MFAYIFRRILYAIPILIGVNLITFTLFFLVNSPDDMARMHLGVRHVTPLAIQRWKTNHGYDKPFFVNNKVTGIQKLTDTLFFKKSLELFIFHFGKSDQGRDITYDICQRMWPSLAIAIPTLLLGLFVNILFAMIMAFFRATYIDVWGVTLCVVLMSISSLFYIIGGQYLFAKVLHLIPISGYQTGWEGIKFLVLPI